MTNRRNRQVEFPKIYCQKQFCKRNSVSVLKRSSKLFLTTLNPKQFWNAVLYQLKTQTRNIPTSMIGDSEYQIVQLQAKGGTSVEHFWEKAGHS